MIEPALSAEEWAGQAPAYAELMRDGGWLERSVHGPADFHKIAALCLDGQEFGFTREDVRLAKLAYRGSVIAARECQDSGEDWSRRYHERAAVRYMSMADRIEAMLRPEA
jgi:hypothetical protein